MAELEARQVEEENFGIVVTIGQNRVEVRIRRTWCEKAEAHVKRVAVWYLEF